MQNSTTQRHISIVHFHTRGREERKTKKDSLLNDGGNVRIILYDVQCLDQLCLRITCVCVRTWHCAALAEVPSVLTHGVDALQHVVMSAAVFWLHCPAAQVDSAFVASYSLPTPQKVLAGAKSEVQWIVRFVMVEHLSKKAAFAGVVVSQHTAFFSVMVAPDKAMVTELDFNCERLAHLN